MRSRDTQDLLPEIGLRVPGPWKGPEEFVGRLPAGCRIEEERFLMPGGPPLLIRAFPADREFASIFRMACRRLPKPQEICALGKYRMIVAVGGPGGSLEAAQRMLQAGAALVRSGGVGVFIDNGLTAHGGSDWLELAENCHEPEAVFYAYVSVARSGGDIVSHGMHPLGQRDAIIAHQGNETAVLPPLEDFLRLASYGRAELSEGAIFADDRGQCFRLRSEPHNSIYQSHPVNNPYGRWRLEPVQ